MCGEEDVSRAAERAPRRYAGRDRSSCSLARDSLASSRVEFDVSRVRSCARRWERCRTPLERPPALALLFPPPPPLPPPAPQVSLCRCGCHDTRGAALLTLVHSTLQAFVRARFRLSHLTCRPPLSPLLFSYPPASAVYNVHVHIQRTHGRHTRAHTRADFKARAAAAAAAPRARSHFSLHECRVSPRRVLCFVRDRLFKPPPSRVFASLQSANTQHLLIAIAPYLISSRPIRWPSCVCSRRLRTQWEWARAAARSTSTSSASAATRTSTRSSTSAPRRSRPACRRAPPPSRPTLRCVRLRLCRARRVCRSATHPQVHTNRIELGIPSIGSNTPPLRSPSTCVDDSRASHVCH